MPLVAHASRVENERPLVAYWRGGGPVRRRQEARPAVSGGKPAAVREQPLRARPGLERASRQGPADRRQPVVIFVAQLPERPDIEEAPPRFLVFECRQGG